MDRDIFPFPKRSNHDIVGIDNFQAAYLMTECLIRSGCKIIHLFYRKDSAFSVKIRHAGYRTACLDVGINLQDCKVFCGEPNDPDLVSKIPIITKETGILCANDSTAAVLMSTLLTLGIKVTQDILIAGFDDMKYSKHLQVPLTTYRQPTSDMARISFELMLNRLSNPKKAVSSVSLIGKLIERESTRFV
jgi:GntR family transcriptional regulator, arabinose operon transcriptional repressor